jgi:hypothetical protein
MYGTNIKMAPLRQDYVRNTAASVKLVHFVPDHGTITLCCRAAKFTGQSDFVDVVKSAEAIRYSLSLPFLKSKLNGFVGHLFEVL